MFGRHDCAPNLVLLTLPAGLGLTRPFGFPQTVAVLGGDERALIGTGHRGARDALGAALDSLRIDPRDIGRVFLSSLLPETIGNLDLFPNATPILRAPSPRVAVAPYAAELRAGLEPLALSLCAGPEGHPDWSPSEVDAFFDAWLDALPASVDVWPVDDGDSLASPVGPLDAIAAPGSCRFGTVWFARAQRWLFTGPTMSTASEPRVLSPEDYTASLGRISRLSPALVIPGTGGVERSAAHFFRATSLAASNLIANMPFALHGPTPVALIAYRDLGYWPRDLVRFTASVWRFKVMLDELVRSGVAAVEGTGAWARYTMDRPPRA